MAVVQCLGSKGNCGGRGAGARGWIVAIIVGVTLSLGSPARGEGTDVAWVPPAALDDAPVRAVAPPPDEARPEPVVVPLPQGLHTGAMSLSALAGLRWWTTRRRRGGA